MSPTKAYQPPRPRREKAIAISCVIGILLSTAILIWFLRPQPDAGPNFNPIDSPSVPIITATSSPEIIPPVTGG